MGGTESEGVSAKPADLRNSIRSTGKLMHQFKSCRLLGPSNTEALPPAGDRVVPGAPSPFRRHFGRAQAKLDQKWLPKSLGAATGLCCARRRQGGRHGGPSASHFESHAAQVPMLGCTMGAAMPGIMAPCRPRPSNLRQLKTSSPRQKTTSCALLPAFVPMSGTVKLTLGQALAEDPEGAPGKRAPKARPGALSSSLHALSGQ